MTKKDPGLQVTRRRLTPADRIRELQESRAKHVAAVEVIDMKILAIRAQAKQRAAELLASVEDEA